MSSTPDSTSFVSADYVSARGASAKRYIWLSIVAAVATIALKFFAWRLSGSVGLLSDALESFVNLASAAFALAMIGIASAPPDKEHPFGHNKAEYFSSGFEGTLIFIAAGSILYAGIVRLMNPQPLQELGVGLVLSAISTVLNLVVSVVLKRAAQRLRSVALEADAQHLMTDVWTSVGVVAGLLAVMLTSWLWLDALIAIAVALHILRAGWKLMRGAVDGLMDLALPAEEVERVEDILRSYALLGVRYSNLKTRRAGSERFVHLNVQVPADWRVDRAHDLLDDIEGRISQALQGAQATTHLEPISEAIKQRP